MKNINRFLLIFLMMGIIASCSLLHKKQIAIDPADMDLSVNPSEDFDNYANGGWKKNHPMPDDKARFGTFDLLRDLADEQVIVLVNEIAEGKHQKGTVAQKIADFYNTGMDTVKLEETGLSPVQPFFDRIEALQSVDDLQKLVAELQTYEVSPMFSFFSEPDQKNSEMEVAYLAQGGLGMPDRDYYMKDDPRSKEIQEAYLDHLAKMFVLLGEDESTAKNNAETVYAIEKRLAAASMTRLDWRDPHKIYHKMNLEGLIDISPEIDWKSVFSLMGLSASEDFIVTQPDFMTELGNMMKEVSIDDWKVYMRWQVLDAATLYVNKAIVDQNFEFFGKVLSGSKAQRPRWKRVLSATNWALDEAVGQMYVKKHFPPEAKQRMIDLVENLRVSLGERIDQLSWMGDETKAQAKDKLAAIRVKVGYPDKWKDYSNLEIGTDSYYANILQASRFEYQKMLDKINKPVDKGEWLMAPQVVNAYYHPNLNEIVFPAAILQPPFFYMDADDAVNYGAIGVVIGHEMTHGFDDQGRQYDKDGNLTDWWTEEDEKRFNARAEVLVDQFNHFLVLDTLKADGKLCLGENIADLGGLNVAYTALKKVLTGEEKPIGGFTPEQRFFLSYAHLWAGNIRDEEIIRRTKEDVHSLSRFRVLGPLRNLPEFYAAFDVTEGDYMYLPEDQRAVIW